MTRLKNISFSILGMIVALAAVGFFASVGLVFMAFLALMGLGLAVAAWVATTFEQSRAGDKLNA